MSIPKLTFHEVDAIRWNACSKPKAGRNPAGAWYGGHAARKPKTPKAPHAKPRSSSASTTAIPVGLLGYADDEPVAWCSIAPRSTYRPLGGTDEPHEKSDADNVWSLVCFFIRREFRGQGVTEQLIEAAATFAKRNGANVLEAYPVDPGSPSYRFMGYVPTFDAAGFEEIGRAGTRRHVMRRML